MSKIASPLTLDLTNTRAFKTWLYDLWQSTGGTTSTAIEDIDLYLSSSNNDNDTAQLEQSLLIQIRDELASINKRLEETQTTDRIVVDEINKKVDALLNSERQTIDALNNKIDEIKNNERLVIYELSRKIDDIVLLLGVVA